MTTTTDTCVTFPAKNNIDRSGGTLVLTLHAEPETVTAAHLLSVGAFQLSYENNSFILTSDPNEPTKRLSVACAAFPAACSLLWTWIGNNHRLAVLTETEVLETSAEASAMSEAFGLIDLVREPYFSGTYDSLHIYRQDLFYETLSQATPERLFATSNRLLGVDFHDQVTYIEKPYLETTLAPRDGSPLLLADEDGPYRRQYFFDFESGDYTDTNTESFIYKGEDALYLAYDGLDPTYTITVRRGAETIGHPLTVAGNKISLTLTEQERAANFGETFTVSYRLAKSYNVAFNKNAAYDSAVIHLSDHKGKTLALTQEGNRHSNVRLAREIELNPLVNAQHTGFLYITQSDQQAAAFRLNLSSDRLAANGLDSATFLVEVIDQEGNEVLSPHVSVYLMDETGQLDGNFGKLTPILSLDTLKARNTAGRLYFTYTAPYIPTSATVAPKRLFAIAHDRISGLGAQIPLVVQPTTGELLTGATLPVPGTALAFEYFARFYERTLPEGHPVRDLDADGNGQLTREDFAQLALDQYRNPSKLRSIALRLATFELGGD